MTIKEVEQLTNITRQNIRFYEREGLITPRRNPENQYREYSARRRKDTSSNQTVPEAERIHRRYQKAGRPDSVPGKLHGTMYFQHRKGDGKNDKN